MSRRSIFALLLLLAFTAGLRSLGITRPLLGNFATRNVVNAMMARNWALGRASTWRPRVDMLADGQRGFHLVEVPVSAYLTGRLWRLAGGSLDVWGRATSVFFSTLSVALLFLLVRRWHGPRAAWAAAVVFALSPVSVIYGQAFMLEPSVVCFTLATLLCWTLWLEGGRWGWLVLATVVLGLLVLTKLYMLVVLLPMAWMILRQSPNPAAERRQSIARGVSPWASKKPKGRSPEGATEPNATVAPSGLRRILGFLFQGLTPLAIDCGRFAAGKTAIAVTVVLVAVAPAGIWYLNVCGATSPANALADRVHFSLRTSAATHPIPHPMLASPDFYRQLLDDLAGVVLTPIAFVLALIGLAHRDWRRSLPWLASMAVLVLVLPLKFYTMNYYYLVVLPPLCVLAGLGWQLICERLKPSPRWTVAILLIGVAFSLRDAAKPAFVTPDEDRGVLSAAEAVRSLTRLGEPVATMHGSTVDLLYYSDRPGWALSAGGEDVSGRLADCQRDGARYLAVAGVKRLDEKTKQTVAAMPTVRWGEDFRVFRLEVSNSGTMLGN